MSKIVGIGETVLDMVLVDGQPRAAVPGGSVFNAMVSLGRKLRGDCVDAGVCELGEGVCGPDGCEPAKVVMVSQLGDDAVARMIFDFMAANGMETSGMKRVAGHQTTVSMALLNARGDASYEFFRDREMPSFVAPEMEFEKGDVLLFGSFFAVDDATREQTRSLVRKARSQGAEVYYDVNFRRAHLADLERLRSEIEENCRLATVVRASNEDVQCVWGISDGATAYRELMRELCPRFIYTCGSDPAEVFWDGNHRVYEVPPVDVVSTIGAGDNFNAGFICGMIQGRDLDHDHDHDLDLNYDLDKCVATALDFSAAVCASFENYIPSALRR